MQVVFALNSILAAESLSMNSILNSILAAKSLSSVCPEFNPRGNNQETHPEPGKAKSDGPNMIPLGELSQLLATLQRVQAAIRED